jgi:hypothetical protein
MSTQIRNIITGWLLVSNSKPLMLTPNKDKISDLFNKIHSRYPQTELRKITVHVERFKEIGRNLIHWSIPTDVNSIMEYRNSLVLQTHSKGCWEWVREKNNLPEGMDYDSMNQWLMDWMKYVTKDIE